MTGHLLVPAIDPNQPATLSRAVLTGLLREELGFRGLIVTDAIEMQAVARRYGLAGATVQALAAGADAICVGGEDADEEVATALRDAIVAAVRAGGLPEERLAEAAEPGRRDRRVEPRRAAAGAPNRRNRAGCAPRPGRRAARAARANRRRRRCRGRCVRLRSWPSCRRR